ncbi:MAG: hypothetical protein KF832_15835 [Caldilineaceae bacterium]|nr:hypothetical protein [Caldilineaceae bacterium]
MVITNLLVAGSLLYAGAKTVAEQRLPAKRRPHAEAAQSDSLLASSPTVELEQGPTQPYGLPLAERRQRAVAATSFWLAVGGLFFTPLTAVSIPLTIYSTVPILEAGCRSLYVEGRLKPSVINSILLASTLVTENYLPAATIAWLHHTFRHLGRRAQLAGEQMSAEINNELGDLVRQVMGGAPSSVWIVREPDSATPYEVKVPFADLKVGDHIVVNRGEFIPADGVIVAGTANVNLLLLTRSPMPLVVGIGDSVAATTFVIEGRIQVQVQQLRPTEPDAV